jgi:hypothetical protein
VVAEQERVLATIVPTDGLVWAGFAEYVLERVEDLPDEALWDDATSCDALTRKYQGDAEKQAELRRGARFCEVEIAQRAGPNPGHDGKGPGKSPVWGFLPTQVLARIRRFFGYRDECIAAIRTDPECLTREGLAREIAKLDAARKVRAARQAAREIVLPPGVTLDGLGATVEQLRGLCRDDPKALDAIDRMTQNAVGHPESNGYIVPERPGGNTSAKALRRLRKDRPDLHAEVLAGKKSPHAAMVEAGFRPKTITVPVTVDGLMRVFNRLGTLDKAQASCRVQEWPATWPDQP